MQCQWVHILFVLGGCAAYVQSSKQPNIVFILADDYGWNDIGYHGSELKTPTLDRLAANGVKLDNYYVQPICTPTRSQLLSGKYQIHTGLQHGIIWPSQRNGLPLEDATIADKLREVGYATHAVGKWHLGFYKKAYTPQQRGFDSHYGFWTGGEDHNTHKNCGVFKKKKICGLDLRNGEQVDRNQTGHYSTHLFTSEAERIIDVHAQKEVNKPLFLYLPYQAVHSPLQVPQRYIAPFSHIKDKNRRIYAGMVACLDEAVANVTAALTRNHLWNNTILIFSTDNGGQILEGGNNWPLRGWKGSLWEGGVRGVGFVHSPLLKRTGILSRGLMHVSDWFPTIVHLAGGTTKGLDLDGYDIWPAINDAQPSPRKELLHNIDPLTSRSGRPTLPGTFDSSVRAAIRVGSWKLITGNPGNSSWIPPPAVSDVLRFTPADTSDIWREKNVWLFNVVADPSERRDLSATRPDIVRHLLSRLAYYNSTAVPVRYPPFDPESNPDLHGGAWSSWVDEPMTYFDVNLVV